MIDLSSNFLQHHLQETTTYELLFEGAYINKYESLIILVVCYGSYYNADDESSFSIPSMENETVTFCYFVCDDRTNYEY